MSGTAAATKTSTPGEIFAAFLSLGFTSFGGPVAHLNYFRREFVERRAWLTENDYAGILGLCQFLPGPASSQTGFCIGLLRGGWPGGLAAWAGFTLPSAVLMFCAAAGAGSFSRSWLGRDILHGLQLAAVAVVAQAVYTMARSLCPDAFRRALAVLSLFVVLILPGTIGQLLVLVIGGLAGRGFLTPPPATAPDTPIAISRRAGKSCIAAFFILLVFALIVHGHGAIGLFDAFYRAGALVFGGGHVVLPLLHDAIVTPGWVSPQNFLTGYGAAQAMPGPLFTFAAYLGTIAAAGPHGFAGALIALIAIFLPGLFLVAGILPFWHDLKQNSRIAAAVMGLNAAVVGLLGYALLNLIFIGAIHGIFDLLIVILAYLALTLRKTPPIAVVAACAAAAIIL
jgi:chromate transporter